LSGTSSEGYAPASGEISGILKQMGDEMKKDLAEATATENTAIANYNALMSAKRKEVSTLQGQIEVEMERIGRLGMEIVQLANGIEDTSEALAQDKKFTQELETSCKTKTAEWEETQKTRAQELVALAETIKVLNDDDALELFKKTLPSPDASLLQVETAARSQRTRALALIQSAAKGASNPGLDLIALALRGKHTGFDKVISLIDGMVANLKKDQADDDAKKDYCATELAKAGDEKKEQKEAVDVDVRTIDEIEGEIANHLEQIKALKAGIAELDKRVAEATEQRKAENEEFKALMGANSAAKQVLGWAKNRLNKFYQPSLYMPSPKRELTEGDAFVQIKAHTSREAPPPAPETFGAYNKKGQQGKGVIAMIDLLVADLEKEMHEAQMDEKAAQQAYEKMMEDAAAKRAADSKLLAQLEAALADLRAELQKQQETKVDDTKDLTDTKKYLNALHAECDWLLKYYDARKEARTSEIESLKNAKAVLNGADYSFVQQSESRGFLARHMQ
jgi:chromosome segregation ATPase